jgi:hypothetical protein
MKIILTYRFSFILFCMMIFFSCNKEDAPDCFKTTGEIVMAERMMSSFNTIHLDHNINLVLHEDTIHKVIVEAGKNLVPGIITRQEGNVLKIYNDNRCNFMRRYDIEMTVHVYAPNIKRIEYNGGGDIKSAGQLHYPVLTLESWNSGSDVILDLESDSVIAVIHTGVSNIYLTGSADYLYLYSVGNSIFHAENFPANDVHCNNGSTGDFFVNALNELRVEIRSYSTTWYKGNPVISKLQVGTGKLEPLP